MRQERCCKTGMVCHETRPMIPETEGVYHQTVEVNPQTGDVHSLRQKICLHPSY